MKEEFVVVYIFPQGFEEEGRRMYGILKRCGLNPKWAPVYNNAYPLLLPKYHAKCLVEMAKEFPRKYGNSFTITATIEKYTPLAAKEA